MKKDKLYVYGKLEGQLNQEQKDKLIGNLSQDLLSDLILTDQGHLTCALDLSSGLGYFIQTLDALVPNWDYQLGLAIGHHVEDQAKLALDFLEKDLDAYQQVKRNIYFQAEIGRVSQVDLLNTILSLLYVQKESWTKRQKEVIQSYLKVGQKQEMAAILLEISQPAVNKVLKSTDFYSYQAALKAIDRYLLNLSL